MQNFSYALLYLGGGILGIIYIARLTFRKPIRKQKYQDKLLEYREGMYYFGYNDQEINQMIDNIESPEDLNRLARSINKARRYHSKLSDHDKHKHNPFKGRQREVGDNSSNTISNIPV